MDVAIRLANWLLAVDIARGAGMVPDEAFGRALMRSIREHLAHVAAHLEWSETGRSNHYLADVLGLLFGAVYLVLSIVAG